MGKTKSSLIANIAANNGPVEAKPETIDISPVQLPEIPQNPDTGEGRDTAFVPESATVKAAPRKQTRTVAKKRGPYFKPTPKKDGRVSISCTKELEEALKDRCLKEGKTISEYVSEVLSKELLEK